MMRKIYHLLSVDSLNEFKLVLTGSVGWKNDNPSIISRSPFKNDIIVTGYVDKSILHNNDEIRY